MVKHFDRQICCECPELAELTEASVDPSFGVPLAG
jgi:hypothetical protein